MRLEQQEERPWFARKSLQERTGNMKDRNSRDHSWDEEL